MNAEFKKIAIIGLGYIGLPTAAMIASRGISVLGVDIDANTVATINAGKIHIIEPDLDIMVHNAVNTGLLRATDKPEPADAFLITVPTPFKENHAPDLSYVQAAIESIAPVLKKGDLIILESTSPVGTTEKLAKQLAELRSDLIFFNQASGHTDVHIAYCPERVMPGHIIRELTENDRIIGGMTEKCAFKAKTLYQLFVKGECIITHCRTAEMTKLTENAFRDVNIAFANELSVICDRLKINVWELIRLANHHPRVNILQPGPGVGGHCIAVDPWFIVSAAPQEARLIRTAREVNDSKPLFVLNKIKTAASQFSNPTIACLGLTYKADTDDVRESPAIEIVHQLLQILQCNVMVVEPNVTELPEKLAQNQSCDLVTMEEVLEKADVIVLLVNHKEFKKIDEIKLEDKIFLNVVNDRQEVSSKTKNKEKISKNVLQHLIEELVV